MTSQSSRRQFLGAAGAGLCAAVKPARMRAALPTAPIVIGRLPDYGSGLVPVLEGMFDKMGGLGRLVKGKTVAIKINMVGASYNRLDYLPAEETFWTHPR
ncbi:MAG TPA: twin-arginine translocation signal domain-containing protein, partial [Bryobacteraceae bacterium]|nr:twin-arginine translocation signal domain-containing protein [Bryobacteraceae bacterium]